MEHITDILRQGLEEYGLTDKIDPWAIQNLDCYCQMLLEKNQVMNLTAIREAEGVARLHMLDCAALLRYCEFLSLQNIRTLHGRAEEHGLKRGERENFDFATARAVADLRVLCELCLPFVKVGGKFLAMKSVGCSQELADAEHATKLLGGRVAQVEDYRVPGTQVTHRLIVIEKQTPTPGGYPRRWAKIQKEPL